MSKIIGLNKSYPSRDGAPVIHSIDTEMFHRRSQANCFNQSCNESCCTYGVDVDLRSMERMEEHANALEKHTGIPRAKWFKAKFEKDREYAGGLYTRTQVVDGACVFLNRNARGCLIHSYCLENGIDIHEVKPSVCLRFPATIEGGILKPSTEILESSLACSDTGDVIARVARNDLEYYFGKGLIEELDSIEGLLYET